MNIARLIAIAVLGTSTLGAGGQSPQQTLTFRGGADAVTVDVSVTTGGRPVTDLTAADFVLLDNGVRQEIDAVSAGAQPVHITVVWDISGSVFGSIMTGHAGMIRDLAATLGADDRLRLVTVTDEVRQVFDFTAPGSIPALTNLRAEGATSLYDAIVAAMMRARAAGTRSLIIVMTDGRDNLSWFAVDATERLARRSDAVVYTVIARDLGEVRGLDDLRTVARTTGGDQIETDAGAPMPAALARAVAQFRSGYVLYYRPTAAEPGWHALQVSVPADRRATVRARQGYWSGR